MSALSFEASAPSTSLPRTLENWMTERWHGVLKLRLTREEQAGDLARASELRARLERAVVVRREDILSTRVQFGSEVTVFNIDEAEEQTFVVVSQDEASVGAGLVDQASPLAQALFGAQEGDEVEVVLPRGNTCRYEVTAIGIPKS